MTMAEGNQGLTRRGLLTGGVGVLGGLGWVGMACQGRGAAPAAGGPASITIERIETISVVVPGHQEMINSPGYEPDGLSEFPKPPKCLLKIYADNGLVGLGETSREYDPASVVENVQFLTGKNVLALNFADSDLGLPSRSTASGFEVGIYDLLGKSWGVPVWQLLGGKHQDRVAVTYWTGRRTGEDMGPIARKAAEAGYKGLKFKGRKGDPVLEEFRAIAKAAPDLKIICDFNRAYDTLEAFLPVAKQLKGFNIQAIEDPYPTDMDGYARLRELTGLPLAITTSNPASILEAIKKGACDIFNFSGGMRSFIEAAHVANAAGIQAWHGSGIELGVRDTSYLHAAAATPNCTVPSDILGYLIRESDLLVKTPEVRDGFMTVPTAPGLGVELDDDLVAKYRVG